MKRELLSIHKSADGFWKVQLPKGLLSFRTKKGARCYADAVAMLEMKKKIQETAFLVVAYGTVETATELAEEIAEYHGHLEWLDDETHVIWEIAADTLTYNA